MKEIQLKELREKCILFNKFMLESGLVSNQMKKYYEESNNLIEQAFNSGNIKSLKAMSNDIDNQIAKHMPLSLVLEIKKYFYDNLKYEIDVFEKVANRNIEKIIKKGKISTDEEYQLLLDRVEEIYDNPQNKTEIEKLNELLFKYHK